MRPSWHDPELRSILNQRKTARDNEWLRKQIGDDTYLRSLFILGYLPDEARTELSLLKTNRHLPQGSAE